MNGKINIYGDADVLFAVYKDGAYSEEIPEKGTGYYFDHANCTNNATATWNRSEWSVTVNSLKKSKTKCSLYFIQRESSENLKTEDKMEDLLEEEASKEQPTLLKDDYNNIRYVGKNPNNYVFFNCKEGLEQNGTNCERWRIIGLMDNIQTSTNGPQKLLKIIKNVGYFGSFSWDYSPYHYHSVNEWSQADLMTVLNDDYLNARVVADHKCYQYTSNEFSEKTCPDWPTVGLNNNARNMVEEVIWNTGTYGGTITEWETSGILPLQYQWERSANDGASGCSSGCDGIKRTTTWTGKVGLIYPSDYGYATNGGGDMLKRQQCIYTLLSKWGDSEYSFCHGNWISSGMWTMTPAAASGEGNHVFVIEQGAISFGYAYYNTNLDVDPVVYLKSSIKIISGQGTYNEPYILSVQ